MPQTLWDILQIFMSSTIAVSPPSTANIRMEAYLARSQNRLYIAQLKEAESHEEKIRAVEGLAQFLVSLTYQ